MTTPTEPDREQTHIPQQAQAQPHPLPAEPVTAPPQRRGWRWPWIALAVVATVAVAGGATAFALAPSDDDKAVDRCQAAITAKLKAPSTAKFGEPTVTSSDGNFGSYYQVFGQVDAQNGFGAVVRAVYHCKVTREKDGRWLVTESTVTGG